MPRREKWGIAGAVLMALEVENLKGSEARLTNVAAKANIAYGRLQGYLTALEAQGLLYPGKVPRLTPRGREFLREYRDWTALLDRFGLGENEEQPEGPARSNEDIA